MASLNEILTRGPQGNLAQSLDDIRYAILANGIPSASNGMSEIRIYVWLILLNARPISTDIYLDLVRQGPSPVYAKIHHDTFRTFKGDPLFRMRVTENSLSRLLNAIAWKLTDAHEARVNGWMSPPTMSVAGDNPSSPSHGAHTPEQDLGVSRSSMTVETNSQSGDTNDASQVGYVQGMNVLAGPFLYAARSEAEAFVLFETFIAKECPGYIRGGRMDGVHKGVQLVDEVLEIIDPKLFNYLASKGMKAVLYAFKSVETLCACTPPLPEVLALWDFLFAYGAHLNIVCIVAHLVLIRDQLLNAASPNQILSKMPNLQAEKIKAICISFVPRIPDELYERIIQHAK
ncbi:cell division control protein-like protein [Aulographum hederae CBS 113979]|uniref:Cell division control protein-like protein n=1 Tax=Aulographum hederae CBS 113979 TaxID=1176131 RepID=A0A6G1H8L7_9PEZI|nr:cell division control protein-like protein [Aulographum hederae CBS 113979]